MTRSSWIIVLVAVCLVATFAYFIWPTPWHYERSDAHIFRINRATGATYVLGPYGWVKLDADRAAQRAARLRQDQERSNPFLEAEAERPPRTVGEMAGQQSIASEEERERARQRLRELESSP